MIPFLAKRRTPSTLLGLTLNGSRLEGVVLRRTNGSLQVQQTLSVALTLNPLNGDPELVGREIRNHLEQAGIRQRRCIVCVPLSWVLTLPIKMPELPEQDAGSFLEIEAERGFPYSPDALSLATSRYRAPGGPEHATLVAIPRQPLITLEKALRAAQLKPVSFTVGITALQRPEKDATRGILSLVLGDQTVDLQVTCQGGVVALRSLDGAIETEGTHKQLQIEALAREIRVTLGQVPEEVRKSVTTVRLFGQGEFVQRSAQQLAPRLQAMGIRLELIGTYAHGDLRSEPPPATPVSPAFSAAANRLTDGGTAFEFLPPKTSPFQELTARFSSRRLAWVGSTAAAALVLILGAIGIQQWQLSRLGSQWSAMEPRVRELEETQQLIRRFRPWFDDSFQNLNLLRRITEAFPAEGVVTAKTVEIRDLTTVTCSGTARDNQAFLKMLDQLRATKDIGGLKVDQVRGKTPLQFTLNFQWGQKAANEN
ncbi:MAG TPA: hypothetical protein VNH84_02195 [Candidatus Saccharimonadales bacterium]|nr:hypothetical protein [Candidatus Saccharimonadales bacterium]